MQSYLVGGAVRDQLLGIKVKDRDWVVVGATPQQMLDLGYQQVGADFPVFLHPETKEEYALARTERKQGQGYTGFTVYAGQEVTLEQDLQRRDLTINAMAMDELGQLIDPFLGKQDLVNRLLRHVSDAFVEDPLRVLRVARFAARFDHLGFGIADETLALMKSITASGELNTLVPERVWTETQKALSEKSPWVYFETLRACGALAVIFPELDRLFGTPQPMKWHPEVDTGIHTMKVLQVACELSDSTKVRFAALCHDLGKGLSDPENLPHHHGHEKAGVKAIDELADRLKIPNKYRQLAKHVSEYHTHCHTITKLKAETVVCTLQRLDAYRQPDQFEEFLLCCEADNRGRSGLEQLNYPQAELFRRLFRASLKVSMAEINKRDLSGPAIGEAVHQQRVKQVAEERAKWAQ